MHLLYCKSELSALIYFSLRYLMNECGLKPSKHTQNSRYRPKDNVSQSRAQRQWELNSIEGMYDHGHQGSGKGSDKGAGKKGSEKGAGKQGYEKGGDKGRKRK